MFFTALNCKHNHTQGAGLAKQGQPLRAMSLCPSCSVQSFSFEGISTQPTSQRLMTFAHVEKFNMYKVKLSSGQVCCHGDKIDDHDFHSD